MAEIALAFTLLTGSVILVAHLRNLGRVPTGLEAEGLLTFELTAPARVVATKSLVPYQKRLIDALQAIPGVTSAALVNQLPLDGCCLGGTVHVEGMPAEYEARRVSFMFVTPGFLPAMGIPLRAGRFLTEADTREDVLFGRRQSGGGQPVLAGSQSRWRLRTAESSRTAIPLKLWVLLATCATTD